MKKLALILIILSGIVIYYTTTIGFGVAEVICDAVNLRAGPGTSYRVISTIKKNQKVSIIEYSNNDWVKVRLANKRTGYITASPEFVRITVVDPSFFVQQVASLFQKSPEQRNEITKSESGESQKDLSSIGYIQTGIINLEQYKNTINLEALEMKTIADNVLLSVGEYKVTISFSKKGLGVSLATEGGSKFEWASNKDNDTIDENIRLSTTDSGFIEAFSGNSGGEIRIAIQKQ